MTDGVFVIVKEDCSGFGHRFSLPVSRGTVLHAICVSEWNKKWDHRDFWLTVKAPDSDTEFVIKCSQVRPLRPLEALAAMGIE